jgi:hypothetical protein
MSLTIPDTPDFCVVKVSPIVAVICFLISVGEPANLFTSGLADISSMTVTTDKRKSKTAFRGYCYHFVT